MSQEYVAVSRRGWPGVILWALLVMASIVLIVTGLWRSIFILGYQPVPGLEEDARAGSLHILGGSAASVGGVALIWPHGMLRHLVALFALPAGMAGMVGGLADRGYRRTR